MVGKTFQEFGAKLVFGFILVAVFAVAPAKANEGVGYFQNPCIGNSSRVAGKITAFIEGKTRTTCHDENETGKLCSKNEENEIHFILEPFVGKQKQMIDYRDDNNKI